jgi:hypothetical protein
VIVIVEVVSVVIIFVVPCSVVVDVTGQTVVVVSVVNVVVLGGVFQFSWLSVAVTRDTKPKARIEKSPFMLSGV